MATRYGWYRIKGTDREFNTAAKAERFAKSLLRKDPNGRFVIEKEDAYGWDVYKVITHQGQIIGGPYPSSRNPFSLFKKYYVTCDGKKFGPYSTMAKAKKVAETVARVLDKPAKILGAAAATANPKRKANPKRRRKSAPKRKQAVKRKTNARRRRR